MIAVPWVDRPWADTHVGETAIIMGNGLSLKDVPKELLEEYMTFAANFICLLPFQPTYFVCVDNKVLENRPRVIYGTAQRAKIAFLNDGHRDAPKDGVKELYQLKNVYLCNKDTVKIPAEFWWTGGTVVYLALKIAYIMGFSTVILVGCDRDEEWKHFSDEYPFETTPPEFKRRQVYHFEIAEEAYRKDGRRIVNLSPPSVLDKYIERGRIEEFLDT